MDPRAATTVAFFAGAGADLVDLDGTLVDSTAPVRRAWGAFADRHGLDREAVHRLAQGRPSRETIGPAGIRAGREAGAKVIALRTTRGDESLGEAQAVVDDIAALM